MRIPIKGHIGPSFVDESGVLQQGVELVDIISAVQKSITPILQFEVDSPGGYVQYGNQIYDYLVSLKKEGKTIEMYQTGLVGSIATKIFMAGDIREVDPSFDFFIHNPWMVAESGDADKLREQADMLEKTESELKKFYSDHTKITQEGMEAIMSNETSLNAQQAVDLGFATRVKSFAFALINKNKMNNKKDDKSFVQHIRAFFSTEEKAIGIAPQSVKKPENSIKNTLVELADGAGSIWLETDDLNSLDGVGAFLVDETGAPTAELVPDGDYLLLDGRLITVAGGLVAAVVSPESAEEDKEEEDEEAKIKRLVSEAVEKALAEKEQSIRDEAKAEILALKKHLKIGVAPVKPFLAAQPIEEKKFSPIEALMRKQTNK